MASLTPLSEDLDIIQGLSDQPNDIDGISAAELKELYDKAGNIIKDYINNTLIPEVLVLVTSGQSRQELIELIREEIGNYLSTNVITIAQGGTGATTKSTARANLGISSGAEAPSGGTDGDIYLQY